MIVILQRITEFFDLKCQEKVNKQSKMIHPFDSLS